MTKSELTTREWLRLNGYHDVADLIDEVMNEWQECGKKTRRNWWEVLAGGKDGKPRTIQGREFPVLQVAQIRQKTPVTSNAICRNDCEEPCPVKITNRWSKDNTEE
jgi:hypothetical protein